jgi:hypothetical protein
LLLKKKVLSFLIIIVAILGIIMIYYYYTSLPSPSIEPEPPQILGYTSHIQSVDSVKFLVIEGVVENSLNTNVHVNVTATFYSAENISLGNLSRATDLEPLKPGQKAPFTFYWPVNQSEVNYKVDLSYARTSEQPVDVLELVDLTNQTEDEQFIIRGEVENKRPLKALNIGVACAYYDAKGNFSGLSRTFIAFIDAGGRAPFEIKIDASDGVENYDLMVFAAGYEEFSIGNYVLFAVLVLIFVGFVILMKRRGW